MRKYEDDDIRVSSAGFVKQEGAHARGDNKHLGIITPVQVIDWNCYIPGDVVETYEGSVGIVSEAQFYSEMDEHGDCDILDFEECTLRDMIEREFQYSLTSIPGYKPVSFTAWWNQDDIKRVMIPSAMRELLK